MYVLIYSYYCTHVFHESFIFLTNIIIFFPPTFFFSIQYPSQNPNAPEVFYRVIAKNGNGPPVFMDDLLKTLKVPLLLLWGEKDPWIRPKVSTESICTFLNFLFYFVLYLSFCHRLSSELAFTLPPTC